MQDSRIQKLGAAAVFFLCVQIASAAVAGSKADLKDAKWIWYPEGKPLWETGAVTRIFTREIVIPAGRKIKSAGLVTTADDHMFLKINGKLVHRKRTGWGQLVHIPLTRHLAPGTNVLAVTVRNQGGAAGLVAGLKVEFKKGAPLQLVTDSQWQCRMAASGESAWKASRELGAWGMAPWGYPGFAAAQYASTTEEGHLPAVTETRPLGRQDADRLLEADWLFQADNRPTASRVREEIGWARELAERIAAMPKGPDLSPELSALDELGVQVAGAGDDARTQYLAVRRVKRKIMFKNPLLDFNEILLVDGPYPSKHGQNHSNHESAHRNGCHYGDAIKYGRLQVLEGFDPAGRVRDLLPEGTSGYLWRPDLSYDAQKVVFCMLPTNAPGFDLYEVNLDGSGFRQLTKSKFDDLDPIYLPDGKILFSTTRAHSYVRCLPSSPSFVLARCDSDGRNIRILSRNNEPDYLPAMLPDGRVIYTRWEYTERPLWRLQGLWVMNPDGTGVSVYWGNRSSHPDMLIEPRPIPGTTSVMFTGAGHHMFFDGSIGIVDTGAGREFPDGLQKVTAEVPWPETGDGPRDRRAPLASGQYHRSGRYTAYKSPYPLGPEDFLVSIRTGPVGSGNTIRFKEEFSLYLMDIHGNRELIYRGLDNVWYAMPVRKRKRPPVRPDSVAWPRAGETPKGGTLYSADVYEGVEGLPRGKAKYLRVIQMDAKTYTTVFKSWRHSGPAISVIQEDGVKRFLGTVPIEKDGSVHFKVPSGKALHFQLLDEHYRCLQIMRSFTGVMPGETRGCHGCHEQRSQAPARFDGRAIALKRGPSELTPPPWGAGESISYERFCQPILDKACGKCHQGDKNPKARAKLDLTLRGGIAERGIKDPGLLPFKEPYLTLVGSAWTHAIPANRPGAGLAGCLNVEMKKNYGPLKPMTMLSYTSPLIRMVMSGEHHGVKVEGDDLRRLIAWVDANCVYRGDEEVRQLPDPPPSIANRYAVTPRVQTAPVIDRLQPVTDEIEGRPDR